MMNKTTKCLFLLLIVQILSCAKMYAPIDNNRKWAIEDTRNACEKRHECAAVGLNGALYLLGGRGIKPVEKYDPLSKAWSKLVETPIEMHHFQAITFDDEIYVMGAFTGGYPHETPIPNI